MPLDDIKDVVHSDCTDMSLGEMFLVFNKALISQSSQEILFFKLDKDDGEDDYTWKQYHSLQHKGTLYFIKGNIRIQVTTMD